MAEEKTKHLKFFGIGRIIPYLSKMKKLIALMVFFGLTGSLTDIILPLFQRYALDHYVGLGVFDTIAIFVVLKSVIKYAFHVGQRTRRAQLNGIYQGYGTGGQKRNRGSITLPLGLL